MVAGSVRSHTGRNQCRTNEVLRLTIWNVRVGLKIRGLQLQSTAKWISLANLVSLRAAPFRFSACKHRLGPSKY